MKIVDNFLSEHEFNEIEFMMMGHAFEWYYSDGQNYEHEDDLFMFNHLFHKPGTKFGDQYIGSAKNSCHYHLIEPCLKKFGSKDVRRIKANLTPRQSDPVCSGFHIDYSNITTAIYYLNTNNGYTEFGTGEKVESVANRAVIFDSNLEHQGVGCTDQKRRVVINFNYGC